MATLEKLVKSLESLKLLQLSPALSEETSLRYAGNYQYWHYYRVTLAVSENNVQVHQNHHVLLQQATYHIFGVDTPL